MFGIGAQELVVILVIALLVFGPKRLPELARSLGRGLGEFRRASTDLRQSLIDAAEEPRSSPRTPPPETVADREPDPPADAAAPAKPVEPSGG